jgi:hypothetical protein
MRRARLTFVGAFHHCVNRGHGRKKILAGERDKKIFLNLLNEARKKMKVVAELTSA